MFAFTHPIWDYRASPPRRCVGQREEGCGGWFSASAEPNEHESRTGAGGFTRRSALRWGHGGGRPGAERRRRWPAAMSRSGRPAASSRRSTRIGRSTGGTRAGPTRPRSTTAHGAGLICRMTGASRGQRARDGPRRDSRGARPSCAFSSRTSTAAAPAAVSTSTAYTVGGVGWYRKRFLAHAADRHVGTLRRGLSERRRVARRRASGVPPMQPTGRSPSDLRR
jgi:hypothetical protein